MTKRTEHILSAFEQIIEPAQLELVDYIMTGSSHRDLAEMFLQHLNREQLVGLIKEVKLCHQSTGDYPYIDTIIVGHETT